MGRLNINNFHIVMSYHKNSSLEGSGGVHYVLQDYGLQFFWIHLICAQRDSVK